MKTAKKTAPTASPAMTTYERCVRLRTLQVQYIEGFRRFQLDNARAKGVKAASSEASFMKGIVKWHPEYILTMDSSSATFIDGKTWTVDGVTILVKSCKTMLCVNGRVTSMIDVKYVLTHEESGAEETSAATVHANWTCCPDEVHVPEMLEYDNCRWEVLTSRSRRGNTRCILSFPSTQALCGARPLGPVLLWGSSPQEARE